MRPLAIQSANALYQSAMTFCQSLMISLGAEQDISENIVQRDLALLRHWMCSLSGF